MTTEELLSELASRIVEEDLKIVNVQKELAELCTLKRLENSNPYFKHMYKQFQKIGFFVSIERVKMSIYVLEMVNHGIESADSLIREISIYTGTTENVIRQNMFDSRFTIYSGIKFAMTKYIKEKIKDGKRITPKEFWKNCDESTKIKLYIELEEYLRNY